MSFLLRVLLFCMTNSVVAWQWKVRNSRSVEALIGKGFAGHDSEVKIIGDLLSPIMWQKHSRPKK
jgi:hypothetical protein